VHECAEKHTRGSAEELRDDLADEVNGRKFFAREEVERHHRV
jgi:hypothetical protein